MGTDLVIGAQIRLASKRLQSSKKYLVEVFKAVSIGSWMSGTLIRSDLHCKWFYREEDFLHYVDLIYQ